MVSFVFCVFMEILVWINLIMYDGLFFAVEMLTYGQYKFFRVYFIVGLFCFSSSGTGPSQYKHVVLESMVVRRVQFKIKWCFVFFLSFGILFTVLAHTTYLLLDIMCLGVYTGIKNIIFVANESAFHITSQWN